MARRLSRLSHYVSRNLIKEVPHSARVTFVRSMKYGVLAFWLFVAGFPLYWMITGSFQNPSVFSNPNPQWLPSIAELTLVNWSIVGSTDVFQFVLNTFIVAVGVVALVTFISTTAGYGLTRLEFPFKLTFARVILFGYMIAPIVLAIPMYIIYSSLGLLNTYLGIIIAHSVRATPFGVWLMWKMFQTVPIAKEEAAWMMGATRIQSARDIALPSVYPGILAVGVFAFATVWGDFTFARILLPDSDMMTLAPGLIRLTQRGAYLNAGHQMVIATIMSVIPMFFAYKLQDTLLRGFRL
jgi:multiple sugar transport system permease protein